MPLARSPFRPPEGGPRRSLLVELADEAEREERAHVLEVRADLHVDLVPAGVALDLGHDDARLAEGATTTDGRRDDVLVGDVLADPLVELALEIGALFPRTDLLTLKD